MTIKEKIKKECQQQMIEILEKVSEQVKKFENIHRGSMPALDGGYYTPPVSQVKINQVSKLSAPPNLPIFLGKNQCLVWKDPLINGSFRWKGL